ncbi:aldehyde ferredoxin oxidoreductase family protein [Chloroflexota bacterium]
MAKLGGYVGKLLRVDLTNERLTDEYIDEATWRKYIGGTTMGTKILFDEVPPDTDWSDPENRLIWMTGPFTGSGSPGSANFSVVTKGSLTGFLASAQANGWFGPRLKFAGYDGIIVQGKAKRWVYLYVHDGNAELRHAAHLLGKDTWETEETLQKEIGQSQVSVSCIGPAGENLVRFATVNCDRGHVCSSNGPGAVMGSKKLKAVVVNGKVRPHINNKSRFNAIVKEWWEQTSMAMFGALVHNLGTSGQLAAIEMMGILPVKNLTTCKFPEAPLFDGSSIRANYRQVRRRPCFGCKLNHIHDIEIAKGPHKGAVVEEPEYEPMAGFGPTIGNTDPDASIWLANVNDRLGMDAKEQVFLMGLIIECYEKGVITKKDTDGLEMTWGNVKAVESMMHKIARRDGFGDVLAEGIYRASQSIGGDAPNFAVYTHKGGAPHVQDPRGNWSIAFSFAVFDNGSAPPDMGDLGDILPDLDALWFMDPSSGFDAEKIPGFQAIRARRGNFGDSNGTCFFCSAFVKLETITNSLSALTGWDFSWQEAAEVGERSMSLQRAFNIKHGHTREDNSISPRLKEALPDGPSQGVSIAANFDKMIDRYNEAVGWDREGRPLPENLKRLGLEFVIKDLKLK